MANGKITIISKGKSEIPPSVIASASKAAPVSEDLRNIVQAVPGGQQTNQPAQTQNLSAAAKSLEPIVDKIVGIFDGAGVRLLKRRASRLYSEEKVELFGEQCAMSDESRVAARTAGARIAARRVKNEEALDFLALGGAFADWGSNIFFALQELKKEENERTKNTVQPNK